MTMKTELNLLPIHPHKKKIEKFSKRKRWFLVTIGSFILLLMGYGVLIIMNQVCLAEIQRVDTDIKNKSDYQIIAENISDQHRLLEHRRKLEEALICNKDESLKVLTGIYDALPAGINLIQYTLIDGKLTVSGQTKDQEDILQFKEQLMAQDIFNNISIQNTTRKAALESENKYTLNEQNIWEFTFELQINEADNNG